MTSERIQTHIAKLAAVRERLFALLEQAAPRAEEQLYSDGAQWTIRQLVIHLMIADKGHLNMIKAWAQGQDIIPADYDIERFNKRSVEKQAEVTLEQAIEGMQASRAELLAWLETADDATLENTGRHASLQIMSIDQVLKLMGLHERSHADDIAKFLNGA